MNYLYNQLITNNNLIHLHSSMRICPYMSSSIYYTCGTHFYMQKMHFCTYKNIGNKVCETKYFPYMPPSWGMQNIKFEGVLYSDFIKIAQ